MKSKLIFDWGSAVPIPGRDFATHRPLALNASVQALPEQGAQLDCRDAEPSAGPGNAVDFKAFPRLRSSQSEGAVFGDSIPCALRQSRPSKTRSVCGLRVQHAPDPASPVRARDTLQPRLFFDRFSSSSRNTRATLGHSDLCSGSTGSCSRTSPIHCLFVLSLRTTGRPSKDSQIRTAGTFSLRVMDAAVCRAGVRHSVFREAAVLLWQMALGRQMRNLRRVPALVNVIADSGDRAAEIGKAIRLW